MISLKILSNSNEIVPRFILNSSFEANFQPKIEEVNWESVANAVKNDVSRYLSKGKEDGRNEKNI